MTYYYICNRNIIVNSYKLFFLSSHFLLKQTKKDINLFYPLSFSSSQLNKHNGKHIIYILQLSILPNKPLVWKSVIPLTQAPPPQKKKKTA